MRRTKESRILTVGALAFGILAVLAMALPEILGTTMVQRSIEELEAETAAALPPVPILIASKVLLALSIAFALNFLLILIYSRKKTLSDEELLSGSCCDFKIKDPETELRRKKKRPGFL